MDSSAADACVRGRVQPPTVGWRRIALNFDTGVVCGGPVQAGCIFVPGLTPEPTGAVSAPLQWDLLRPAEPGYGVSITVAGGSPCQVPLAAPLRNPHPPTRHTHGSSDLHGICLFSP